MKKIKIIKEIFTFFKKIMHHFIARLVNSFKNSRFLWFQRSSSSPPFPMVQIDEIMEKECHQIHYKTKWGGLLLIL
jgi:hypothetical protein